MAKHSNGFVAHCMLARVEGNTSAGEEHQHRHTIITTVGDWTLMVGEVMLHKREKEPSLEVIGVQITLPCSITKP